MSDKPFVTDEVIEVAIPKELAEEFMREEAWKAHGQRGYGLLQFGTTDLGYWRIEGVATNSNMGVPRIVATLRKVLL